MKLITLYKHYQRLHWYVSKGAEELGRPTQFLNNSILITLGAKLFGWDFSLLGLLVLNILAFLICLIIGKLKVIWGIVEYENDLNGKQNPQLMEILRRLDGLEGKISVSKISRRTDSDN